MPSASQVQPLLVLAFWALLVLVASVTLRRVCEFFAEEPPTPGRALFMSVFVAVAVFFTLEFSSYLIMRAMADTVVAVPPGYGFWNWVFEPVALKWAILGKVPFVRYLPFVFALCVAGALQCILFELKVSFRLATFFFLLQWILTISLMAALLAGVNVVLARLATPAAPGAVPPAVAGGPQGRSPAVRDGVGDQGLTARQFWEKFHGVVDPYLREVKQAFEPVTRHLPEGVRAVLDGGGWWVLLGAFALLALFWVRRALRAVRRFFRPRKRKKKRPTYVAVDLREDLSDLEAVFTEEGERQILVKGVPARLRLVVLSQGIKGGQRLSEDMADALLEWVCPGLADAAEGDYPRVRLWPPYPSPGGFDLVFAQNVQPPGGRGPRSPWVLVSGRVQVGDEKINVGLGLVTGSPTALGHLKAQTRWNDVLAVTGARAAARA